MEQVQVAQGREAQSHIIHCGDGYYYHVREFRSHRARLKCRHYSLGCRGTASVNYQTDILTSLQRHTCRNDPLLLQDAEIRRAMIAEARDNVNGVGVRQILRDFRLRCNNPDLARRFTPARMHSSLYEARSSNYPRIPETLTYLGVLLGMPDMRAVCRTIDGQDYIFKGVAGTIQNRSISVIFASGRMLRFLETRRNLHMDGTFKKRPKKPRTMQIFNIVTNYGDTVVPIMRALMMRRTEVAYNALFDRVKELAPNLSPDRIHCDFELALMNSLHHSFPDCPIAGCLWHYAVACSSKARKLGLRGLAVEFEIVLEFIRCLCGAPLLPALRIEEGVNEIWREVEASGWGGQLQPLFTYFRQEWLPRRDELSVFFFPERTNNCSEADNHALGTYVPQNRPNVWRLVGGFVQSEHIAWCDKEAVTEGDTVNGSRRWKTVMNDNHVRRMSNLLLRNDITAGGFLHGVSYSLLGPVHHGLRIQNDLESDSSSEDDSD